MKKIYVAGPYSSDPQGNTDKAVDVAEELSKKGWCPHIPHLTHYWEKRHSHPYEFWLNYDNEWLPYCDALFRIEGDSSGADKEVSFAKAIGMTVYHSLEEVPEV